MLRNLNYIDTFIIVSSLIHHPLVTAAWLTIRNYSGLLAACGGSPGFGVGAGCAAAGGTARTHAKTLTNCRRQ